MHELTRSFTWTHGKISGTTPTQNVSISLYALTSLTLHISGTFSHSE